MTTKRSQLTKKSSPYIENPKTKGSGILCAIPQKGVCPLGCKDCFFQSGRSYLEPLEINLPNLPPPELSINHIIRVNDGNDSNIHRPTVIGKTNCYPQRFFNTSIPNLDFPAPVVLTVNPALMTDREAHWINSPIPPNLMFVRVRTNTWNLILVDKVVQHYTNYLVPVVLTFMAYYEETVELEKDYVYRKRILNPYWVITPTAWNRIVEQYKYNPLVYTCGKDAHTYACCHCGNCLREYFATIERMQKV